jgi:hypothetical protein
MLEKCAHQIDKISVHIFLSQLAMDKHHLVCDNDDQKTEAKPKQGQQDSSKESSHSSLQTGVRRVVASIHERGNGWIGECTEHFNCFLMCLILVFVSIKQGCLATTTFAFVPHPNFFRDCA